VRRRRPKRYAGSVVRRSKTICLFGLLVSLSGTLAACRAPQEEAGSTTVTRTRVSRVTGTAMDTPPPEATADDLPGQKCKHVFHALDRETHMYVDTTYDLPMTALCTPIRCEKCGQTRHECVRQRRR
jgi:hypothetical protein